VNLAPSHDPEGAYIKKSGIPDLQSELYRYREECHQVINRIFVITAIDEYDYRVESDELSRMELAPVIPEVDEHGDQ